MWHILYTFHNVYTKMQCKTKYSHIKSYFQLAKKVCFVGYFKDISGSLPVLYTEYYTVHPTLNPILGSSKNAITLLLYLSLRPSFDIRDDFGIVFPETFLSPISPLFHAVELLHETERRRFLTPPPPLLGFRVHITPPKTRLSGGLNYRERESRKRGEK